MHVKELSDQTQKLIPCSPFILLDNRDEFFDRPTAAAHWWEANSDIYAPQDLKREERGTWIGVSKTGKAAVLVNYFERNPQISKISRGLLPRQFLESSLSPKSWIQAIKAQHKEELDNSGGFTLLVAQVFPSSIVNTRPRVEVEFLCNEQTELPSLKDGISLSLSNGSLSDTTWTKTAQAMSLANLLYSLSDASDFTQKALELLSTSGKVAPRDRFDVRHHIFIKPFSNDCCGTYGTRTQTVILVDQCGDLLYTEKDVQTGTLKTERIKLKLN